MKQILAFCCSLLTPVFLFAQTTPVQDVHFVRGIELQQAGKLEEAISEYELSLKTNPRYPVLANLGAASARLGRYQEAIARYEEALKLAPGKPEITLNLGLAHYKTGEGGHLSARLCQCTVRFGPSLLQGQTACRRCQRPCRVCCQARGVG